MNTSGYRAGGRKFTWTVLKVDLRKDAEGHKFVLQTKQRKAKNRI